MNHLHPFLTIQESKSKGKGVFALQDIEANTLLEISPVIVLSEEDTKLIHQTHLHDYYFTWAEDQKQSAIGLGYISIYNHSASPNCSHECNFNQNSISIYSKTSVLAGEELTIDYNMGEEKPLWFEPC
jgi:hypothetical protein